MNFYWAIVPTWLCIHTCIKKDRWRSRSRDVEELKQSGSWAATLMFIRWELTVSIRKSFYLSETWYITPYLTTLRRSWWRKNKIRNWATVIQSEIALINYTIISCNYIILSLQSTQSSKILALETTEAFKDLRECEKEGRATSAGHRGNTTPQTPKEGKQKSISLLIYAEVRLIFLSN